MRSYVLTLNLGYEIENIVRRNGANVCLNLY